MIVHSLFSAKTTEAFVQRLAGHMTAEEARKHLLAVEPQCQTASEQAGWVELAKVVLREIPRMTLRLAVDLVRADARSARGLMPPFRPSADHGRYLSKLEIRELLGVVVDELVEMTRDDVHDVNQAHDAMGALLETVWEHERWVELPPGALDRLVRAAMTTEVVDEFSRRRVQWTSYTALSVQASRSLSDETFRRIFLRNYSLLDEADFVAGTVLELFERPGLWDSEKVRSDLAYFAGSHDLAQVLERSSDEVFADLLRQTLENDPDKAVRAVTRADEQARAGRYSEAEDWLPALSASDCEVREGACSILGHVSAAGFRTRS